MFYKTRILNNDEHGTDEAAQLLRDGKVVAIPTETVYGLAADASNEQAVRGIFDAKNRPADNPLIVHICSISQLDTLAHDIPPQARRLAESLMPAPLTLVLPKRSVVPLVTSGGLETVGIRMPMNLTARKIIEKCGLPLAAPSANRSGYPSPTSAMHVYRDMRGRIPAIVDDGECAIGIESTVVSFDADGTVRILRPGFITREDLLHFADSVVIDKNVTEEVAPDTMVASPGMKYKHYSPKADVFLLEGSYDSFRNYLKLKADCNDYALLFDNDVNEKPLFPYLTYGSNAIENAHQVFSKLRELDELGAKRIFVRCPEKTGVGLAVYNRLIRAAGFKLIEL